MQEIPDQREESKALLFNIEKWCWIGQGVQRVKYKNNVLYIPCCFFRLNLSEQDLCNWALFHRYRWGAWMQDLATIYTLSISVNMNRWLHLNHGRSRRRRILANSQKFHRGHGSICHCNAWTFAHVWSLAENLWMTSKKSKVYTICRTLKKIKHSTWHFQFLSSNHSKNSNVYLCHHVLWFGGKLFLIETCPG